MGAINYLQERGFETIDSDFYTAIDMWDSWYKGMVKKFHQYKIYNGKTKIKRQRATLGMAKKVAEDLANLLMNEKVEIVLSDDKSQAFLDNVFKENNFVVKVNESQENKAALGTVAYVPYIEGATVKGTGPEGGKIKINYIQAKHIYPLSWDNGKIIECAFGSEYDIGKSKYLLLQIHRIDTSGYIIENVLFKITDGKFDEASLKSVDKFKNMAKSIKTLSFDRQFVIDRLNITNNFDTSNPMGISLYANSTDILRGLDLTYDSYQNEFILGRKRIFVRPEMLSMDDLGDNGFDPNDEMFYQLPEDGSNETFLKESNLALRADEHNKAITDNLNLLSTKIGFGESHYKFDRGTIATATQVVSENSTLYRTIKKHEIILDSVLKELVDIILRLGVQYKIGPGIKREVGITIDFDDSIIEDKQAEFQRDLLLVNAGSMGVDELRAKYMNEDIEEARANLPEMSGE